MINGARRFARLVVGLSTVQVSGESRLLQQCVRQLVCVGALSRFSMVSWKNAAAKSWTAPPFPAFVRALFVATVF